MLNLNIFLKKKVFNVVFVINEWLWNEWLRRTYNF